MIHVSAFSVLTFQNALYDKAESSGTPNHLNLKAIRETLLNCDSNMTAEEANSHILRGMQISTCDLENFDDDLVDLGHFIKHLMRGLLQPAQSHAIAINSMK